MTSLAPPSLPSRREVEGGREVSGACLPAPSRPAGSLPQRPTKDHR